MKRYSFLIILFLIFHNSAKAQFYYGPGLSFLTDGDAIGIGANTLFNVTDEFQGSLNYNYYFGGKINWDLNVDAHYQFVEIGDDTFLNPFGGLNIRAEDESVEDVDLGIGINMGLFIHTPIYEDMRLYIEGKYSLVINGSSGGGFSAGVFF